MIEATQQMFFNYKVSCNCFSANRVVEHQSGNFISPNLSRGFIADNLVRGLPWWFNFSTTTDSQELFKRINYERDGLYNMIQNARWDEEAQKLFVRACHEALRKIYAKIYGRTKEDEYAQIERENERIRSELLRCVDAESFRSFILRFWSRAGQVSITQDYWEELLPLTTGRIHWKVGRDLALLALVSYKPSKKSQSEYSENSEESFDTADSPQTP